MLNLKIRGLLMTTLNKYRIHHNGKKTDIHAKTFFDANEMYIDTYLAFNNEVITEKDFKIEFIKGYPFRNISISDYECLTNEYGSIFGDIQEENYS
jgi:hypothetical protein